MLFRRSTIVLTRRAVMRPVPATRSFVTTLRRGEDKKPIDPTEPEGHIQKQPEGKFIPIEDVKTEHDLLPPGAEPGTVPSDFNQSTGLERLEILAKMQGIDIFDMRPLDSSRRGTMDNPIRVRSAGDEQYAGCTGCPADSHVVKWLTMSRDRPIERCPECGSVYEMEYVGPPDDPHHHHDEIEFPEPKTFADYVKPEYRYI